MGEARCFAAERNGVVFGTIGAALRPLWLPSGKECSAVYLGDLKITADARQGRALVRLAEVVQQWVGGRSHAAFAVFQQFLRTIDSAPETVEQTPVCPAVRAFNSVLTAACVLDELEVGVGCMGIIEFAFAGISAIIGRAVVERGWVASDRLVHYKLHAAIDERHAEEFFAVVEPRWDDAQRRYYIEQGLGLGAHIFDRLYRDLYADATEQLHTVGPAL